MTSTVAAAPKMPSRSEVFDLKETSMVACDATRQRTSTQHAHDMKSARAGSVAGGGLEARADLTTSVGDARGHERGSSPLIIMRNSGGALCPSSRPPRRAPACQRCVDDLPSTRRRREGVRGPQRVRAWILVARGRRERSARVFPREREKPAMAQHKVEDRRLSYMVQAANCNQSAQERTWVVF